LITRADIGRRVQDDAGRIGVLTDVVQDYIDPAAPPEARRKQTVAFVRPEGGGREWTVLPGKVRRT